MRGQNLMVERYNAEALTAVAVACAEALAIPPHSETRRPTFSGHALTTEHEGKGRANSVPPSVP